MEIKRLQPSSFKQLLLTIYSYQEEKLVNISKRENLSLDTVIRYIFERAISEYVQDHLEIKEKCYCNCCGQEYPKRKMHRIAAVYDLFVFCDHCFYGGKYKKFIYQIIG